MGLTLNTLVKVQDYSLIQDFEADFQLKVSLKMLNLGDYNRFSYLYTVCLKTTDHLNLNIRIFTGHTASFGVSKVQDFGNFELSPMFIHVYKWIFSAKDE